MSNKKDITPDVPVENTTMHIELNANKMLDTVLERTGVKSPWFIRSMCFVGGCLTGSSATLLVQMVM